MLKIIRNISQIVPLVLRIHQINRSQYVMVARMDFLMMENVCQGALLATMEVKTSLKEG